MTPAFPHEVASYMSGPMRWPSPERSVRTVTDVTTGTAGAADVVVDGVATGEVVEGAAVFVVVVAGTDVVRDVVVAGTVSVTVTYDVTVDGGVSAAGLAPPQAVSAVRPAAQPSASTPVRNGPRCMTTMLDHMAVLHSRPIDRRLSRRYRVPAPRVLRSGGRSRSRRGVRPLRDPATGRRCRRAGTACSRSRPRSRGAASTPQRGPTRRGRRPRRGPG